MAMTWPQNFLEKVQSLSDLWRVGKPADLRAATDEIWGAWREEEQQRSPNLLRCLWRVFGRLYVRYFILFLVLAVGQLTVATTMSYMTQALKEDWHLALILACVYSVASFMTVSSLNQGYFRGQVLGSLIRHCLTWMLIEKFGRLAKHKASLQKSLFLTLISSELDVFDSLSCTPFLIVTPVYVLLAIPVVWMLLGGAGLIGIVLVLLIYPAKLSLLQYVARLRKNTLQQKELRAHAVQQLVEGIRTVKMYGWEEKLAAEIEQLKRVEHKQYVRTNAMQTISATFLLGGGALILMVTLAVVTWLGEPFDTSRIFGMLSVLVVMNNLVHGITNGGIDAAVYTIQALKKVTELLLLPEYEDRRTEGPLCCSRLCATWEERPALRDVSFRVEAGELCIVVGEVGSGKSTLLALLAGELVPMSGSISISASAAFVEQEPWMRLGTIKDNILLGEPLNEERYFAVLKACAFDTDLARMAAGDETDVGEKGSGLSGGQKARLALARAAYRQQGVYLLDDCLSALDTKVAQHVFQRCITGLLKSSTRILVTSNPEFLPYADKILVLKDGEVVSFGTSAEVLFSTPPAVPAEEAAELTLPLPVQAEELTVQFSDYLSYLKLYFRSNWALAGLVGLAILVQAGQLSPYFWVSVGIAEGSYNESWFWWVMISLVAALFCVAAIRNVLMYSGLCRGNKNLHDQALRGVCNTSLDFFEKTASGHVVARFTKDMAVVEEQLVYCFSDFLLVGAVLASYLIALVAMSPVLLPFLAMLLWAVSRVAERLLPSARRLKRLELVAKAQLVANCANYVDGLAATRSFGLLSSQQMSLLSCIEQSFLAQFASVTTLRVLQVRVDYLCISFTSLNAIAAALAGSLASSDILVMGFSFTVVLISYLGWFTDIFACLGNYMISAQRLQQFARLPPEEKAHSSPFQETHLLKQNASVSLGETAVYSEESGLDNLHFQLPADCKAVFRVTEGRIVFNKVCLCYSSDLPLALRDVSFELQGKTHTGVVGRTGAGKSSLVLALLRLKELCSGCILIDGQDISNVPLQDLRKHITVIPQTPLLFRGTLRRNADPTSQFTEKVVSEALEELGLDCQQQATQLSGGQKQLLCLARAMLRDTPIYVCDEATASLDLRTEDLVRTKLQDLFADRTVLTIAHRLGSVLTCSQVLVLEAGECVERGMPQVLIGNADSRFSHMLRAE